MADETLSKASLLHGISDLWQRFFADKNQLEAMYRGTEIVIGQAYLDLMASVLNISLREIPVWEKEYFKLLTVRADQVTYRAEDDVYVFELPDNIKSFQFLYNKVWAPSVVLENDLDFEVDCTGTTDDLIFYNDPFDWDGAGSAIPGIPMRTVEVDGVTYKQLAFWIPDAQVDRFGLYLTYGYLLKRFEISSESYRALLQGISRYFVLGPTFQHLLSALSVIVGLPVIRDDDEILQEVDMTSVPGYAIVKTDKQDYKFDAQVPLRTDVLDEDNWEVLTFKAFDHLTEAFTVKDAVTDPTWFFDITIPEDLMPDETRQRRALNPNIFDNLIDNPPGLVKIGDPGFFIGADDTGEIPPNDGGDPPVFYRSAKRHLFSYIVFERFLKHHIFAIILDQVFYNSDVIPFPRLDADILNVVVAGKSAYVYLYFEHGPEFKDKVILSDALTFSIKMTRAGRMDEIFAPLQIGFRSWKIGDYFKYNATGGIDIGNGTPDKSLGETPLVIGGEDPNRHGRIAAVGNNTRRPLAAGSDATFTDEGGGQVEMTVGTPIFHDVVVRSYVDGLTGPGHTGGTDRLKSETYQFGPDDIGTYVVMKTVVGVVYKIVDVDPPTGGEAVLKDLNGVSPTFVNGTDIIWWYIRQGDGRLLPLEGLPDGRFIRHHDGAGTTHGYYEILGAAEDHVRVANAESAIGMSNQHWELWNYEGEEEESSCWDWPLQLKVTVV